MRTDNVQYDIEIADDITNGTIQTVNKTNCDDTITVTAIPDDGYKLESVKAVNSITNKDIAVTGGTSESGNKVEFVMPRANVTVSAVFEQAENYTIKIPNTGSKEVTMPLNVDSFQSRMQMILLMLTIHILP